MSLQFVNKGVIFLKNVNRIIWGIILILVAAVIALNSLDIIEFNIFFDGWWTLFIIIPSFVNFITKGDKITSLVFFAIGVFLLLCCQDILEFEIFWKLLVPAIIAIIGVKLIFSSSKKSKTDNIRARVREEGREIPSDTAVFNGAKSDYTNRVFDGAELTACFGGVECDLCGAIIDRDCVINASAIFGGITIYVPDDVRVISNATGIFGGIEINKSNPDGAHTLYIDGVAAFGGIEIK